MFSLATSNANTLIDAISKMPTDWALTPCVGKQNLWPKWPSEKLDRTQLIEAVRSQTNHEGKRCNWTGVSVVTGPLSDGLMAIDFDGPLALTKYFELSGGVSYPTTKRWTSGKGGHFQILLEVPREKWEGLAPIKFFILKSSYRLGLGLSIEGLAKEVGAKVEDIEKWESGSTSPIPPTIAKKLTEIYDCSNSELCQKLELRWNECSTLPPSIHPDTKEPYFWKNDGVIAQCPDFILELMREIPAVELSKKPIEKNTIYKDDEKTLVDILENEILPRLDAEEFYGNWVALKKSGSNLKGLCPFHDEKTPSFSVTPSEKTFHCFGCGAGGGPVQFLHQIKGGSGSPTGKEFAEVVRELAGKVGVQMPDFQPKSQNLKSNTQYPKPNNLLKHPANYTPEPAPATEIIKHADGLLEEELTPTNQIIGAIAAAKRAGLSPKDFREILAERQAEQDLDFSLIDSVSKFKQLHQIQNSPINLHEFFPPDLAKALLSKAESDRIDPVRILQSLLPVVGTMLGSRVGIELKPGNDEMEDAHIEHPIFYTCDVGYPSTGKSATQESLIRPLQKMQDAEQERMETALIERGQLEEAWKDLSKEQRAEKAESDENPRIFDEKYCKPKKWLLDEASAQALTKRISEQEPRHGCLLLQDELAGLFNGLDQFTGGKGNQREFLLKAWSKPLRGSVDRVDLQNSYFFKSQTLSITGTMQPDVARRIFNTASDPDGMLSRFLPSVAELPPNFAEIPTVRVSLNRILTVLIKDLEHIPETLLTLPGNSNDTRTSCGLFWKHWQNLRQGYEMHKDSNPAYAYFLGKQISYVGRFAIVLHCLENLGASEMPTRVTSETMNKAVRLSLFYCNQFLLLQSKSANQQPIEGILLDILKFVQQQGGTITTRQLCQSRFKRLQIEGKKFSAYFAQKFLQVIADAGYGNFENKTLNLLPLLPFVTGGVTALKPIEHKALSGVCRQNAKVYVSENFEVDSLTHTENFPDGLIDESDSGSSLENLSESEKLENIYFPKTATPDPQTLITLGNDTATKRQQNGNNGNKRQHLENFEQLNEDEIELLEMLQRSVAEKDPNFAKDVRGILKNVCGIGVADRKKVWEALEDAERKIFTELLAVKILVEVPAVTEPDSLDVEIQKLTNGLVVALDDGPTAVVKYAAQFSPENIERAIALLESLKDDAAVEEIRDALS